MHVKKWLELVAYVGDSKVEPLDDSEHPQAYYSKFDDSYMTLVGMENNIKFLADREITDELKCGVGFSPNEGKWYGWSHRVICGFKVGSECKKGMCHYTGKTVEDELQHAIDFWTEPYHQDIAAVVVDDKTIHVSWTYSKDPKDVPNEKLHGTISGVDWHYVLGKGEWTAETMEDAKQMAIDFAEGVS